VNTIDIVPIAEDHIESYHRTLDVIARERRYLSLPKAPPLEETRSCVRHIIEHGYPQLVALAAARSSAGVT
jgi:hypothetical protein